MDIYLETIDLPDDASRQYIDARSAFTARSQAQAKAREHRGGMVWKTVSGYEYLIRTSTRGAQKSLGPRSSQTEQIYEKFTSGKHAAEERLSALKAALERHQKMNRALRVGRTPKIIVDILNMLEANGLSDSFMIIGTNALYAYETAAGVRINERHLATRDVDLLWDNRRKLSIAVQEGPLADGMLGLLKKIDRSFAMRTDQLYTAVNKDGYEVDILRRHGPRAETEPERFSQQADDFWVVKARNADWLLSAPKFREVVVSSNGNMAQMVTVDPRAFCLFKLWMAEQKDRDPLKRRRDVNQAKVILKLIQERMPQFSFDAMGIFPESVMALLEKN
jgi:hypothetical protein